MWSMWQIMWVFTFILTFNGFHFVGAPLGITNSTACDPRNRSYFIRLISSISNGDGTEFICAGSLIKQNEVLTAAHCCQPNSAFMACSDFNFPTSYQTGFSKGFKIHPKYNHIEPSKYDLCIIKLAEDFELTNRIQLVELATSVTFKPVSEGNKFVDLVGARIYQDITVINITQCTQNIVSSTDECVEYFKSIGKGELFDRSSMFCILVKNNTQNIICQGESGGPVMYKGIQVGVILSFIGTTCDNGAIVFARVDSELGFIEGRNNINGVLVSPVLYIVVFVMNMF